jgi:hypothetical protein
MAEDYDVGYGKPPKEHRFPPGKSGNVKGRPPGRRNFKTILKEEMQEPITLTINGKTVTISTGQALIKHMKAAGFGGNLKAVMYLLDKYFGLDAEEAPEEVPITSSDKALLDSFMRRHKKPSS